MKQAILEIADALAGRALVVVDEAYIEFSQRPSLAAHVASRPQLAVLRTLSKAHGLAGARLGTLIADPEVIALLRKLIAPYAISAADARSGDRAFWCHAHLRTLPRRLKEIRAERDQVAESLRALSRVTAVLPSEANFLLARLTDSAAALTRARVAHVLVRDARGLPGP